MRKQGQGKNEGRQDKRVNQLDDKSKSMIYDGCNLSQLCSIFKMDRRTVSEKIRDVVQAGQRSGYPVYLIHEVAPYLVKPLYDIETYIARMNHKDLPPMLQKEYWSGLKARQDYLLKEGELWHTEEVLRLISEMYTTLRMTMMLGVDMIERDMILTKEQRRKMTDILDGTLNAIADKLVEDFDVDVKTEDQDEGL